jgi:hypothetical protein
MSVDVDVDADGLTNDVGSLQTGVEQGGGKMTFGLVDVDIL